MAVIFFICISIIVWIIISLEIVNKSINNIRTDIIAMRSWTHFIDRDHSKRITILELKVSHIFHDLDKFKKNVSKHSRTRSFNRTKFNRQRSKRIT